MSAGVRTLVSPAVLARPRGKAVYWTVFTGVVLLFTLAFLFPVYWMVTGAMKSPDEVARTPPTLVPESWSTAGYGDAWELMQLPTHLWNTVVQAAAPGSSSWCSARPPPTPCPSSVRPSAA